MAQDLFRFHNRSKFEVHVYATTPNDSEYFLEHAMGGVDWRAKVFYSFYWFIFYNVILCNLICLDS